jgi:hypothetical protein
MKGKQIFITAYRLQGLMAITLLAVFAGTLYSTVGLLEHAYGVVTVNMQIAAILGSILLATLVARWVTVKVRKRNMHRRAQQLFDRHRPLSWG